MDVAYKQHANQDRRKNRSSTNLNRLSLAPLTSKLPLTDPEHLPGFVTSPVQFNTSYLQGKSAPTTPRLLRSPARTRGSSPRRRVSIPEAPSSQLPKSKSTTYLAASSGKHHGSGTFSPLSRRRRDEHEPADSDWVLRIGALISSEARESKGQAWLISRASSTSLTGLRDTEEEAYERELAREKELVSRRTSRRGSLASVEEGLALPGSRLGSRSQSRVGSKTHLRSPLRSPLERHIQDGYFNHEPLVEDQIPGPDFVSLDEELEALELDSSQDDEATVRRLVSRRSAGVGSWVLSLFSVEENDEDSDTADGEMTDLDIDIQPHSPSTVDFNNLAEERLPPPLADEGGSWQDAAWLLSVASRVLL